MVLLLAERWVISPGHLEILPLLENGNCGTWDLVYLISAQHLSTYDSIHLDKKVKESRTVLCMFYLWPHWLQLLSISLNLAEMFLSRQPLYSGHIYHSPAPVHCMCYDMLSFLFIYIRSFNWKKKLTKKKRLHRTSSYRCGIGKGNGNSTQYSCLISLTVETMERAVVHGITKELNMTWQLNTNNSMDEASEASYK